MNSVKATCTVELQIDLDDVWTEETTMGQIVKQAKEGAIDRVQRVFADAATDDKDLVCKRRNNHGVSLIGISKVVTRVIEEK